MALNKIVVARTKIKPAKIHLTFTQRTNRKYEGKKKLLDYKVNSLCTNKKITIKMLLNPYIYILLLILGKDFITIANKSKDLILNDANITERRDKEKKRFLKTFENNEIALFTFAFDFYYEFTS